MRLLSDGYNVAVTELQFVFFEDGEDVFITVLGEFQNGDEVYM